MAGSVADVVINDFAGKDEIEFLSGNVDHGLLLVAMLDLGAHHGVARIQTLPLGFQLGFVLPGFINTAMDIRK